MLKKLAKVFMCLVFIIGFSFLVNVKADSEYKTYDECVEQRKCTSLSDASAQQSCKSTCNSITGGSNGLTNEEASGMVDKPSSSKCSYKVSCADMAKKYPNASVYESKTTEILAEYFANNSTISVKIDGTSVAQFDEKTGDGYNITAGKFCGYDFNDSVYTGINVTYLIKDNTFINGLNKSGDCPKLSVFYSSGFYATSPDYLSKLDIDVDTYEITGTREESTVGSSSKKLKCYYSCSEFNGDETISIIKNEDDSFSLDANYLETYKSDWYNKLNWSSSDDCSSTIYKNGEVNSYYYDTSRLDKASVSCKKIDEDVYYSALNAPVADEDDNLTAVCGILTPNTQKFIYEILDWIKYLGLILSVVLGVLDFMKAMSSSEDDAFKKAGTKFGKRIIAVVVLFLIPVLLSFILTLVKIQGVDPTNPLCL